MTFRPGAQVIWKPPGAVLPIKATFIRSYPDQGAYERELLPMLNGKG